MTRSPIISPVARQAADWLKQQLPVRARLSSDSRWVAAGDVFVAYPGETSDGRSYIGKALAAGAGAVVLERAGAERFDDDLTQSTAPALRLEGLRRLAGEMAAAYLDEPSARMTIVAVTGTNGKTSCTYWIAQGCNQRSVTVRGEDAAAHAVVIGTLGAGVPGQLQDPVEPAAAGSATPALLTTPDAIGLQQQFLAFADQGVEVVALEASSIGLQQGRLNGTCVDVAVLTNLSRDHLDYHVTMQAYAAAKARLFSWPTLAAMVVNLEDPASTEMLNAADPDLRRIGYLINDEPVDGSGRLADAGERSAACSELLTATPLDAHGRIVLAHFRAAQRAASNLDTAGDGSSGSAESVDLTLALIGRFNLSNALAVAGVWMALGWTLTEVAAQLERLAPVPGRLQLVGDPGQQAQPLAVVDYAHTPDALASALQALRPLAESRGGRLWCVFGAGGNRDAGKRQPMAAVVERHADLLVLTSDNPRNEAPDAILAQLREGLSAAPRLVQSDRALAIDAALQAADAADVVLIAGKGHESYQEIGGRRLPFSDVEQARLALAA
ncbi:MAG: UDP-N-acetylmuramoyl-L-alanyl-D-glutamate--2,6-diaminopimelate ligase, partial [Lautropia sp.]